MAGMRETSGDYKIAGEKGQTQHEVQKLQGDTPKGTVFEYCGSHSLQDPFICRKQVCLYASGLQHDTARLLLIQTAIHTDAGSLLDACNRPPSTVRVYECSTDDVQAEKETYIHKTLKQLNVPTIWPGGLPW